MRRDKSLMYELTTLRFPETSSWCRESDSRKQTCLLFAWLRNGSKIQHYKWDQINPKTQNKRYNICFQEPR